MNSHTKDVLTNGGVTALRFGTPTAIGIVIYQLYILTATLGEVNSKLDNVFNMLLAHLSTH